MFQEIKKRPQRPLFFVSYEHHMGTGASYLLSVDLPAIVYH